MAPQVRLELTTLRLTAECSAIELLRIIRGLFAARLSAGGSLFYFQLTLALSLGYRLSSHIAFSPLSLGHRLGFAPRPASAPAPFFLMFESGKNFRSSRSLWIPATSYSPKPFPAQYHQRLEA